MDTVTKKIGEMVKDHEAAIKRLRDFRRQYVESPDLRDVIAALVHGAEPSPAKRNGDIGEPSKLRVNMLKDAPGMTAAIIEIVEESPGIQPPDLIDRVLDRVKTKSGKPRRAVASTYDYLVNRKRILKVNGGFYPIVG